MVRIVRLMKLHKLMKPAGEHGSDAGGSDTAVAELDDESGLEGGEDQTGGESNSAAEDGQTTDEAADEVVISIGEEAPQAEEDEVARAPEWVRDLRKQNREKDRRIRELEQKVSSAAPAPQAVTLGTKPTLEGCDFDAEKFETELESWHARKREVEEQQRSKEEAEKKARDAWQAKLTDYGKAKTTLKVRDFDDAEATVHETLSVTQQGVILNGADNAAVLIYALGKNPKKAKELASITDPVKFAFAAAKLETQLKVTPRRTAPVPERTVRGSAPGAGAVDSTLDKLRAEADRTGDRSKVSAYLRDRKKQA